MCVHIRFTAETLSALRARVAVDSQMLFLGVLEELTGERKDSTDPVGAERFVSTLRRIAFVLVVLPVNKIEVLFDHRFDIERLPTKMALLRATVDGSDQNGQLNVPRDGVCRKASVRRTGELDEFIDIGRAEPGRDDAAWNDGTEDDGPQCLSNLHESYLLLARTIPSTVSPFLLEERTVGTAVVVRYRDEKRGDVVLDKELVAKGIVLA